MSRWVSVVVCLCGVFWCCASLEGADRPADKPPVKKPSSKAPATPVIVFPPDAATTVLPIPAEAQQARARAMIKEVFAKEYAQRGQAERAALARRLLEQVAGSADDPAARFALLCEARDIAALSGEAALAEAAIEQLRRQFAIDYPTVLIASLGAANLAAATPQAWSAVAQQALGAIDRIVQLEDFDTASRLCAMAEAAADKAKNLSLKSQAQLRGRELAPVAAMYEKAKAAAIQLRNNGDDPQAAADAGRFACLIKNDFATGLPLLARSSDVELRQLARDDLGCTDDAGRCKELADRWWELSQSQQRLAKRNLQGRAAHWYRRALPGLGGLNLELARKRLNDLDEAMLKERNLAAGLRAQLFKGTELANPPVLARIDPRLDFEWDMEGPDEQLGKDNFSIRWTGLLFPPAAGKYDLVLVANMGARVWLGDKLVFDARDISRKTRGERVIIDVAAAPLPLRVDYWDTTGKAKLQLKWRPPGSDNDELIPPSALLHEATP